MGSNQIKPIFLWPYLVLFGFFNCFYMTQQYLDDYLDTDDRKYADEKPKPRFVRERVEGCMSPESLMLHSGAISIFFYPDKVSVRADTDHVYDKCPKGMPWEGC